MEHGQSVNCECVRDTRGDMSERVKKIREEEEASKERLRYDGELRCTHGEEKRR